MEIRQADPRDISWEDQRPSYRVYFWDTNSVSSEHEVVGAADVDAVLRWAEVKDGGEPRVEWWVDMGSVSMNALGALMLCLQTWSRETDVALRKLVFGDHEGFTAGP